MERRNFIRSVGMVAVAGGLAGCEQRPGQKAPDPLNLGPGKDDGDDGGDGGDGGGGDGGDGGDGDSGGPSVPSKAADYLDGAKLYEGSAVDKTGSDSVGVDVGAGDNGLAYGPPAVVVSTGTTVTWTWTGEGGGHNVVAEDGGFKSGDTVSEQGETFEHTFEETGVYNYYCTPHKALGMKGSIIVK